LTPHFQVSFDDGLEEELERITNKYPPGTCSLHPDIECYHSRVTDLHFKLDRPKKIVWAAAIVSGVNYLRTTFSIVIFLSEKGHGIPHYPAARLQSLQRKGGTQRYCHQCGGSPTFDTCGSSAFNARGTCCTASDTVF
jgi:hypothetical protein